MTVAIRDLNRAGLGKSLAFLLEFFKHGDMSGWLTRDRSVGDSRTLGSVRSEPQPFARQRLRRLRIIIWCGAATLGIVLWFAIWFLLDQTRRFEMNQALKDLQHLDHAFGASSIRWLGEIEVSLKSFEQTLAANRSRRQWLEQQQIQLGMRGSRGTELPISQAMAAEGEGDGDSLAPIDYRYIDRLGREAERIAISPAPPLPALASRLARPSELSRDYFQFHADSESEGTYVSKPWRDSRTGQWRLSLSRRVDDGDGAFAGVVVATLDPNFLSRLFRAMDVGGLNSVSLLGDDGVVRLDSKAENSLAGLDISNTPLFQGIRASQHLNSGHRTPEGSMLNPHNQWLGEDPITGSGKAYSFTRAQTLPLWIVTETGDDQIFARYRLSRMIYLSFGGGMTLLILLLSEVMARSIFRQMRLSHQLLEATEIKTQFLTTMSHELRTPMNGVIGIGELLGDTPLSFEQSRFVSLISRSARGLKEVIDDILETSNLQAGRIVLTPSRFELVEFCESIIEIYTPIAREQRLELGYLIHPKVPAWIEADPAKLRQILMSLVGNAIKFTPRGHILVQIGCTAQRESEPLNLWVEVADTGIGIPDSLKPAIFDAFVQGDPSLRRAYGGTGLGLAIARQLVEIFGGKIGVSDRDGGGTIFRFSIPLKPIPPAEMPGAQPMPNLRGKTIWLYSQSLVTQLVLTTSLGAWGGRVEINPPIPNGLRLPRSEAPALVVIDRHSRPAAVDVNELLAMTQGTNGLLWLGEIDEPAGEVQLARPILQLPLMAVMNRLLHRPAEAPTATERLPGTRPLTPLQTMPQATSNRDSSAAKILLVEDNKINQTVVTTMLTRLGHSVEAANNGQSALKLLDEKSFDLVLMDLQMPGMDGEEATRRIRAETRFENLPIIAFTAHALSGVREKVLAQGFDECLSKPVKREQFAAVVARWRSGRRGAVRDC